MIRRRTHIEIARLLMLTKYLMNYKSTVAIFFNLPLLIYACDTCFGWIHNLREIKEKSEYCQIDLQGRAGAK